MKITIIALAAGAAALAGCANVHDTPLASAPMGTQGRPIIVGYTGSEPAGMLAGHPGKALIPFVGGVAMASDGLRVVRDNHIEDPALDQARRLAEAFSAAHAGHVAQAPLALKRGGLLIPSPAQVAAAAGGADYVVDVETQAWGFTYYARDPTRYHVLYAARMRLVDARRGAIAAEHICRWDSDKKSPRLTREEMLGAGAAGLKAQIAKAADQCLAAYRLQLLQPAALANVSGTPLLKMD